MQRGASGHIQQEREREYASHADTHVSSEFHHHHRHAGDQHHAGGHHLLQVEGLSVSFERYEDESSGLAGFLRAPRKQVCAIRDLSISVHVGEIVAVVGASGSGKSLLADSIMGIFQPNSTVSGHIWFDGERQSGSSLAKLRGNGISLVPQSVESLDPLMKVGKQVREIPRGRASFARGSWVALREEQDARAAKQQQLFARYQLDASVADLYPFQLSGGMTRRVLLCCALMESPKLIIADEPTPGLDLELAVQAMQDLKRFADSGGGVMLITHDIELALRVADRVAVFLDGSIVEETSVEAFTSPDRLAHPFSRALWHALPEHDFTER